MEDKVDLLVYVALAEEFGTVISTLGEGFVPKELEDVALTLYFGTIRSEEHGDYRIAVVPAGKMGNTHSATVTSALLGRFKPHDVVVLGIAGSLSNDMEPGDVFIPDSVNEYLANSASKGGNDGWTFETSGNHFQTSVRLLNRLQNFQHAEGAAYAHWAKDTKERRAIAVPNEVDAALHAAGQDMRGECKLFAGDDRKLASGPAVGKGKAFVTWVTRDVDRKVAAMEMETAGVYNATIVRTPAPRTIAIRGISDFADERKAIIERVAKGVFRALSVQNAVSLFVHAVKSGLFRTEGGFKLSGPEALRAPALNSHLKAVFVIGGVTGETEDIDAEAPRLNSAALRLGKILSEAGAQLIVCSPFTDSADYYTAMGYAQSKLKGVIQFHSPKHASVDAKRKLLQKTLGHKDLTFQHWDYPGPELDEKSAWHQAWLLSQLQALEKADAIITLGGKVSNTANTLLHLAEGRGLPIVPFEFLGGAARRAFLRRDWTRLNPKLDTALLTADFGIDQTVSIANLLLADLVSGRADQNETPKIVFISRASQDKAMGDALAGSLKRNDLEVILGDDEIRTDQLIPVSIQQGMLKSDVCAVLWSRDYALSPHCFDELSLALGQQAIGKMKIWLFNLDDSPIVPPSARKLPAISVRSKDGFETIIDGLLDV